LVRKTMRRIASVAADEAGVAIALIGSRAKPAAATGISSEEPCSPAAIAAPVNQSLSAGGVVGGVAGEEGLAVVDEEAALAAVDAVVAAVGG
jgi:hypothetical protein